MRGAVGRDGAHFVPTAPDHVQFHAPVSRQERLSMLALPQSQTDSRRDDCTDTLCVTIKYTVK